MHLVRNQHPLAPHGSQEQTLFSSLRAKSIEGASGHEKCLAIVLIAREVVGRLKPRNSVLDKNVLARWERIRIVKSRGIDAH